MPSPICRQQQLQSGFRVARTVGLFAHCPSSKAKGGARCQVQYAASSNFNRASESLGQSDYSPTVLAAKLRGEVGAKSNMPRGRLPFPRIFLSQSSSVPQDNLGTALPFPRIISRSALPFPRITFAQFTSVPQDISRSSLPFPSKLGGGFAALLLP